MAMMMDIPVIPNPRPMAPAARDGKPAQAAADDGFGTALKEETRKQTRESASKKPAEKESTEKRVEDKEDESGQAVGQEVVSAASASPAKSPVVVESGTAVAAAGAGIKDLSVSSISEGAENGSRKQSAPLMPELPSTGAPKLSASTESSAGGQTTAPALAGAPEPRADAAEPAGPASREKNVFLPGEIPIAVASSTEEAGFPQTPVLEAKEAQADQAEAKTGRSGLMEASFAGLLQPAGAKSKGDSLPETPAEIAEISIDAEKTDRFSLIEAGNGESDAGMTDTLPNTTAGRASGATAGEEMTAKGQTSLFDSTLAATASVKPETTTDMNALRSIGEQIRGAGGSLNEEVRVLDQVLHQLPLNRLGEKSRVVIRLHPEELGEVKLDLVMEKDQLKAQLVTQTQQVQSILEKHLPRLQEALQNQGIKLDQIEVSVDSQGNQGRETFDRNQQPPSWVRSFGSQSSVSQPAQVAAALNENRVNRGGLSLRI